MKRTLLITMAAALFAVAAPAQFVPSQKGYGPGNAGGYQGDGPKDGTGYGAKANKGKRQGGATCDGTGPKGQRNGGGQGSGRQGGGGRRGR